MKSILAESKLDIDRFIEKRLLEIADIEERKAARENMGFFLKELYRYAEDKLKKIEENIALELADKDEAFNIQIGVASKNTYDITVGSLYPLDAQDTEGYSVSAEALGEALRSNSEVRLCTVFLELGYEDICNIVKKKVFTGCVHTDNAICPVTVELRPAKKYFKIVEELFKAVTNNGLVWSTLCIAYLYKFYDVYIIADKEISQEPVRSIEVDFKEYEDKVRHDCFPVWNMEECICVSEVKKVACLDTVRYQHLISKYSIKEGSCIITDSDLMLDRHRTQEGIVITTDIPDVRKWKVWRIVENIEGYLEYPVLGVSDTPIMPPRTKGAVFKTVQTLGCDKWMRLKNVSFEGRPLNKAVTYYMDSWLTGTTQIKDEYTPMVLEFVKNTDSFLTNDILSYIVTVLQRKYPEFCCYGVFVEE